MAMNADDIRRMIATGIPGARVVIEDLRGDGEHYHAIVEAEAFRGKTRIQQHQMIYQSLGGKMGGELHALMLTTRIPAAA